MTSLAFDLAKQVETMSDPEFEFLWDIVRKRHNESLLSTLDMKLEESMNADSLSDEDAEKRLRKLGIV
ncbi:hypothetical protein FACS189475_01400 [Betaproteobacteria bacterium]|nr:hypothetical protein FACS189475_01400 [Betaproteobacteria bacterium]